MRSMVWFRRDLRLQDHPALHHASEFSDDGVVAVYAVTPKQWAEHDESAAKVHFWLENLRSLAASLNEVGIPLQIVMCDRYEELPGKIVELASKSNCESLHFHHEYEVNESRRDAAVESACSEAGIQVFRFHDRVIVPPREIQTKEGRFYSVFTPYRKVWDAQVVTSDSPLPPPNPQPSTEVSSHQVPTQVDGFDFANVRSDLWAAGEDEAHRRLEDFLARISRYDQQRDVPSVNGTSLLSPYLAAGVLSPRYCFSLSVPSTDGNPKLSSGATTWISELTWRDFYTHVLVGFPRVSMHLPFKPKTDHVRWRTDSVDFEAWCSGHTGYPIVDAGMRQLNQTGWMHNRLRMVTAMFLSKHLLVDWRWGEKYFMQKLIDGDLAANNGGWQWSASTGTDSVPYFRIFNPFSQSKRFDPDGTFIKKFCPELSDVPPKALHDPVKLRSAVDSLDIDYSDFVVDHKEGRDRALDEFKRVGSL